VVIPPEDAVALARQIEEFYHNPELVGQMSMAGRKYAETHYSFQGAIALYEQLFDEVMRR